jgi:hypothetical protein
LTGAWCSCMDNKAIFSILACADKSQGQLGRSGILKLLQGRESRKLAKLKLDHLPEHGTLSAMSRDDILDSIDYLIERGCLAVSTLFFPMLGLTEAGKRRLVTMGLEYPEIFEKPTQEPDIIQDKVNSIHVCNEVEFWQMFPKDLAGAKSEVLIFSPFVSSRRVDTLLQHFNRLISKGVKIHIYVRPATRGYSKRGIEALKRTGAKISYRDKMHHKAAIIDRAFCWEGSLNILQHWDSHEQMTRHTDAEYIKSLLGVLNENSRESTA